MFERYTEKARRVIFFARYEASQFGSPYIETEHLLLGLLREDKALANRFLRSHAAVESIPTGTRAAVLGGLTVFYAAALVTIILAFRRYIARQPSPFSATRAAGSFVVK